MDTGNTQNDLDKSAKLGRLALKSFFETGDRPTEAQFSKLIDSVVVQDTDRIAINKDHEVGLGQTPEAGYKLTINGAVKHANGNLLIDGGHLGIGTANPAYPLEAVARTVEGQNGAGVAGGISVAKFVNNSSGIMRGLEIGAPSSKVGAPVYLQVSGTKSRFAIANREGKEALTITHQGNVGIGTNAPQDTLSLGNNQLNFDPDATFAGQKHVGTIKALGGLVLDIDSNDNDTVSKFMVSCNRGKNILLTLGQDNRMGIGSTFVDQGYMMTISGSLNVGGKGNALIKTRHIDGKQYNSEDADALLLNWSNGFPVFVGSGANHANLYVSGKLSVGNFSPHYHLDVSGTIRATGDVIKHSDARYKKEIKTIPTAEVDKLYQVRGTQYQYRTDEYEAHQFAEGDQLGIIAQELKALYPALVKEDNDGYLHIAYQGLIPVMVEALKQQKEEIQALRKLVMVNDQ